ncbi:MAG: hypothetical protein J7K72_00705 [Candidatus Aenigmarchaeota archaeon]|nr:hypothetical protein [Candidatus Aenigmarchaeota archaeon]
MSSERKLYVGVIVSLLLTIVFVLPSSAVNSNSGNFTVTPDNVYLNWSTSAKINLTSNNDSVVLLINNESTSVEPRYFTNDDYKVGNTLYPNFNGIEFDLCFTSLTKNGMKFVVQNSTDAYVSITNELNNTNSSLFTLTPYLFCPPGYYFGQFNVTQNGTNDYATLNMSVNIPISGDNTFNSTTNKAGFKGTFSTSDAANKNSHIYYFNTSLAENATYVSVNLTWDNYNQDLDLFLFDSSDNLLTQSNEKNGNEYLIYEIPSTSDMWKLKIYGNVSSPVNYTGWIYFTTLNVTNTSDDSQKIDLLDFDILDPNETSETINYTLVNEGNLVLSDVKERKEVYHINAWSSNKSTTYNFLVPDFTQKLKVVLSWKGSTKWKISLNDSNNNLIGSSYGKYYNANVTDGLQKEIIIFNGPFNTTNDGFWRIKVENQSEIKDDYNLTVYLWIPNSIVVSNYPTIFTFNSTGNANSTKNVSVYLKIPEEDIIGGDYEGFIEYYQTNKWSMRIPLEFHVKAGTFLINNTLETVTVRVKDNIGFNRLGSNALKVSLPVKNIGEYNITYTNTTSDYKLNNTAHTDKYIDFNVTWPDNPIKANSTDELNITIYINTSKTNDTEGVYRGNITFDTSAQSANSSSYPFKKFVVIIEVNLTKYLEVNVTSVSPTFVSQTENSTNITANITVKLANGSYISENETMKIYDFTSTKLKEGNVTTTTYTLQNITGNNPSGVACPSNNSSHICMIKSTLPGGSVGGRYYYIVSLRFNTSVLGGDGVNLTGTGTSSQQIVINNTGIFLSETDHPPDVYEGETIVYTVLVRNYGPLEAKNLQIRFDKGSCPVSVSTSTNNCSAENASTTDWKISNFPEYCASWCKLSWTLTGNSVSEDSSCSNAQVKIISGHANFGNITGIRLTVKDNSSTSSQQATQQQQSSTCSSNSDCADSEYCLNGVCTAVSCPNGHVSNHVCIPYQRKLSITEYPREASVMQGSTTSLKVTVKNIGDLSATTKLEIIPSLNGTTFSVSPDSYTLLSGISGIFTVKVSVSNKTEIGRYNLQFKAYATENSSVYDTKDFTLVVEPTEETKIYVNKTYNDIKKMFNDISLQFEGIIPTMVSDINYTRANRTYTRLITMLKEAENYLRAEKYVDAYMLLKEANESLKSFQEEVNKLIEEKMTKESSNMWIFIGIGIAVVVIGALLVYLLLPPKKGYHPAFGYTPPKKRSVKLKINFALAKLKDILNIVSHMKRIHHKIKQKRITDFEVSESVEKLRRKVYSGDYTKLTQFAYKYKKGSMKKK